MFKNTEAFSSFSVDDISKAKTFYADTLGLDVSEQPEGLAVKLAGGGKIFIYPKKNHQPASHTVLNFPVESVENAADALNERGIDLARFDGIPVDEKGISRGNGPTIAWFRDPAGNILSILEPR